MKAHRPFFLRAMGLIACLLFATIRQGTAMNHNLACPWGDACSPPQTPYLSFHSLQSPDMLFAAGEEMEIICHAALRSVALRWTLHRNMVHEPFRAGVAEALPGNRFAIRLATADLPPGFYDVQVELDTGLTNPVTDPLVKRPVHGVCTFGWKVDRMAIAQSRPVDFNAFWDEAKAKLATMPIDAREGPVRSFGPREISDYNVTSACLPPDYDPTGHRFETVESCKVDLAGPDGGRVYGWLAKPPGKGPFPAMLVLPGAGFAARPRPLEHARHGYVALDIQIHGQDVDQAQYEPIPGYYDHAIYAPPSAHYYYNVHLRCLQAVNYLLSRPDVDPTRLVVVGGSQGGRLGIVVAGLDPRVRAVVSCIAHAANQPHLRWVAGCNSTGENGMDLRGAPPVANDAESRCLAYFDPMNFASDIRCPVLMNAGLIDPVSPPFSIWAVFNGLSSRDKVLVALDGLGHDWSAEFDRRAWKWLDRVWRNAPAGRTP